MNKRIDLLVPYMNGNPCDMTLAQKERIGNLPEFKFNAILLFIKHQFANDQPLSWKTLSKMRLIYMVESGGPAVTTALNRIEDYMILGSRCSCEKFWIKLNEKIKQLKEPSKPRIEKTKYRPMREQTNYFHRAVIAVNGCLRTRTYVSS